MIVITARNVHDILPELMYQMRLQGVKRDSRNGPVLKLPTPATLVYQRPWERVLFWPERDANPFLHFFESLWMLAGRNDVEYPAGIVPRFRNYSDDGVTFNGAYGHRWRQHFAYDQLNEAIVRLRKNPDDRRVVVGMWDPWHDMQLDSKDLPCNTQVMFSINEGKLDMMVTNRSNDAVWGATGANAVHFSFLQEYVAQGVGVPLGQYWQVSNNMHLYTEPHEKLMHTMAAHAEVSLPGFRGGLLAQGHWINPYDNLPGSFHPLISTTRERWDDECRTFVENGPVMGIKDPFFRRVATPLWEAYFMWYKHKDGGLARYNQAYNALQKCASMDWRVAATEWVARRENAEVKKLQQQAGNDDA